MDEKPRIRFSIRQMLVAFIAFGMFFGAVGACVRYEAEERRFRWMSRPSSRPTTMVGDILDSIYGVPNSGPPISTVLHPDDSSTESTDD